MVSVPNDALIFNSLLKLTFKTSFACCDLEKRGNSIAYKLKQQQLYQIHFTGSVSSRD